jgi:hypothetical protein
MSRLTWLSSNSDSDSEVIIIILYENYIKIKE